MCLDLPLPLLLVRALIRSWRRWRSKELLWGTKNERFWPQLEVWQKDESLLWWIATQHRRKRRALVDHMASREWAHICFVRLVSTVEIERFVAALRSGSDAAMVEAPGKAACEQDNEPPERLAGPRPPSVR